MIYLLDSLNWHTYVDRYGRLFSKILEALNAFTNAMVNPLSDLLDQYKPGDDSLANALVEALNLLFGHLSIIEVCIGGGLTVFIVLTVAKWLIGIVT